MKKNDVDNPIRISGLVVVLLHLVPGIIFGCFFLWLARVFIRWGLTGYLALLVSILVCLAPMEIGIMVLYQRRTGKSGFLENAIVYRRAGKTAETIAWGVMLFLIGSGLTLLAQPLSAYFEAHLTDWLPVWATQTALANSLMYSAPTQRAVTLGIAVILSGIVSPLVEELYFRGFLLPRMKQWGWAAPIINAFLFAIYHFYIPENVPGIFAAFLPLSYVVMLKKDWRISLISHSMFNLMGVITLIASVP